MENKNRGHSDQNWHPLEYAHVYLWLIKDMCWAQGWVKVGTAMVIPTVLFAYIITWIQREKIKCLVHNVAISLWITANSLWMLAEFYHLENELKPLSSIGFAVGLLVLGIYYLTMLVKRPKALN